MSVTKFKTPPALAKEAGVSCEKIIGAINRGELRAINLSDGIRPRWRITEEDWQTFLASKSNQKPVKQTRRRAVKTDGVIPFYS